MDVETVGASVVASVASKVVFHPIDTIRTIKQASVVRGRVPLRMYWNGLLPSTMFAVPGFTAYLVAYRQTKSWLSSTLGATSITNYVISGAMAELASSFIWTPMEVLKGRMQISSTRQRMRTIMKDIYLNEGMVGFFRGYWMGIVVFLPHSIVWWVSYENVKLALSNTWPSPSMFLVNNMMAAGTASVTAGTFTNFLDVIKTRQQLAYSKEIGGLRPDDKQGVIRIAFNLIKEGGMFRAVFKGLGSRLVCAVPSSMFTMAIVEMMHPDPNFQIAAAQPELDP